MCVSRETGQLFGGWNEEVNICMVNMKAVKHMIGYYFYVPSQRVSGHEKWVGGHVDCGQSVMLTVGLWGGDKGDWRVGGWAGC